MCRTLEVDDAIDKKKNEYLHLLHTCEAKFRDLVYINDGDSYLETKGNNTIFCEFSVRENAQTALAARIQEESQKLSR